jgi:hydrogenase maturation protease
MSTLVLGLGNSLLSDDAVGLLVAEEVGRIVGDKPGIVVRCGEAAGFRLVDMLTGFDKAIIIDAIISDRAPAGESYWMDIDELRHPLKNLSNHNIHLADALDLGKGLGMPMPKSVKVLAVEVEDCYTLSERIGEVAKQAIAGAVKNVLTELGLQ